jgi:hypothetical protein
MNQVAIALWSRSIQIYVVQVLSKPVILMFCVLIGRTWVPFVINGITAWLIT